MTSLAQSADHDACASEQAIIDEGNLQENPLVELAAQQYLSSPGHENVLTLVRHAGRLISWQLVY